MHAANVVGFSGSARGRGKRIAGTLQAFGYAELAWQATPALNLAWECRAQGRLPVNDANSDTASQRVGIRNANGNTHRVGSP